MNVNRREEVINEVDVDSIDLRKSWKFFGVPNEIKTSDRVNRNSYNNNSNSCNNSSINISNKDYTLIRPYRVVGTNTDEQSLLFLSLASPNRELLRATVHLFIQLNLQYRQCVLENEEKMLVLRNHHEQQLTDLLEAANSVTRDMVVGSDVTQRFVLKHQYELEDLQRKCRENEIAVEKELYHSLFAFLKTSTPDAMAALSKDHIKNRLSINPRQSMRVNNISYFVSSLLSSSSEVPVRTVELPNLLRHDISSTVRPKDISIRPIVVDISPISLLPTCLKCLYSDSHETAAVVVEEHLIRLAQQTHAVLLLIGTEAEAEFILSSNSAELLLNSSYSYNNNNNSQYDISNGRRHNIRFIPLRYHRHLKIMLSTRFWGANIILLWTPPSIITNTKTTTKKFPLIVEDAMNLSHAWNADMFSVAIINSGISMQTSVSSSNINSRITGQAQELAMEVLRQLQRSVGRLSFEAIGGKQSSTWGMSEISEEPENENEKDNEEYKYKQKEKNKQRWEDGHAIVFPTSVGAPRLTFNTPIAIRVFLPNFLFTNENEKKGILRDNNSFNILPTTLDVNSPLKEKKSKLRHATSEPVLQGNESFSSDLSPSLEGSISSQHQPMTLKKILVYTFGESVIIH